MPYHVVCCKYVQIEQGYFESGSWIRIFWNWSDTRNSHLFQNIPIYSTTNTKNVNHAHPAVWFWCQNLRNQDRIPICPTNSATSGHALTGCAWVTNHAMVHCWWTVRGMSRHAQEKHIHDACFVSVPVHVSVGRNEASCRSSESRTRGKTRGCRVNVAFAISACFGRRQSSLGLINWTNNSVKRQMGVTRW